MKIRKMGKVAAAVAVALFAGSMWVEAKDPPPKAPEAAKALAAADNSFGLDLFKKLHKTGENTFISPTSIAMAMQMARQGAKGETRDEMDKAMHLAGIDPAAANKSLIAELNSRQGIKLSIANSIWGDPARMTFTQQYVKDVQDNFESEARAESFSDPATLDLINGWISDKTEGLIPHMLDEISPEIVAFLINAIYFKGDWTIPFKKEHTKEADWKNADGSTSKIDLMARSSKVNYAEVDGVQVAKLPYGKDEQSAMWVALPKDTESLDALVAGMDAAQLAKWRRAAHERPGTLKLPRFTMKFKKKIGDDLRALGMGKAFSAKDADFSPMGTSRMGPLFIGMVLHEAVIVVNEEGTEAAAATIVGMVGGGAPPKPFAMTCDRPFFFVITDEPTGAILFMGTVYKPDKPKD